MDRGLTSRADVLLIGLSDRVRLEVKGDNVREAARVAKGEQLHIVKQKWDRFSTAGRECVSTCSTPKPNLHKSMVKD
jgi:hypothetical protein